MARRRVFGGSMSEEALVGLWVDAEGVLHRAWRGAQGDGRTESTPFRPFAWVGEVPPIGEWTVEALSGPGLFRNRVSGASARDFEAAAKAWGRDGAEILRPHEHQTLVASAQRMFAGLPFASLRRCQLDIETSCEVRGGFSDPSRKGDRVIAVGLSFSGETGPLLLEIESFDDAGERALLKRFGAVLAERDPDIIEGHNIFNFDLDFLGRRAKRLRVERAWGRFGAEARFRKSRIRLAERWADFTRCELPGRTVFDTWIAAQVWDVGARELPAYGLKAVAAHFGISGGAVQREHIDGAEIEKTFRGDRPRFRAYLADDLRETAGLADRLLPTYVAQAETFPMLLQEICLRGTAQKVDAVLLDRYFHARAALPAFPGTQRFEGGFSKSFEEGLFREVLHFDVASLYPSLLLRIGRNPANDHEGVFIPLLRELREYRLKYKRLAAEAEDPGERAEYTARQASYKILINSFYGYLGFAGARFADSDLAAEVTRRGRELLQGLVETFRSAGCRVLEADTDGLYVHAPGRDADELLRMASADLPEGIELEFGGRYEAMFCYKAKNYALYDGARVVIRGSALRSRGMERFLKDLTRVFVSWILGAADESPAERVGALRAALAAREVPVADLAKSENLSMAPGAYAAKMAAGGKPRRAALEVALRMDPVPRAGERVRYYLREKRKGETADWQRAEPVDAYDPAAAPYDARAYLKKLDDWWKRYGGFVERGRA